MIALYWLHFAFLACLAGVVGSLFWLARLHDRG